MSKAVRRRDPDALRRNLVMTGMVIVLLALLYGCAVLFLPGTWANLAREQAGGSLTSALGWGVFYGVVFTFFPALVIGFAFYRRRWATGAQRVFVILVGVLLSAPNLITAGIVFGHTSEAAAAHTMLSKDAPGFAWATLIASVVAFAGAVTLWILAIVRRRAEERLRALRRAHGLPERPPRQSAFSHLAALAGGSTDSSAPSRPSSPVGSSQQRPTTQTSGRPAPVRSASPRPAATGTSARPAPAQRTMSAREREAERDRRAEHNARKAGAYGRLAARGVHRIRQKLRDQDPGDR